MKTSVTESKFHQDLKFESKVLDTILHKHCYTPRNTVYHNLSHTGWPKFELMGRDSQEGHGKQYLPLAQRQHKMAFLDTQQGWIQSSAVTVLGLDVLC